jgi:hypothetical protein
MVLPLAFSTSSILSPLSSSSSIANSFTYVATFYSVSFFVEADIISKAKIVKNTPNTNSQVVAEASKL